VTPITVLAIAFGLAPQPYDFAALPDAAATLRAFAVRINMTQQHDADLDLQQLRAEAALNSGVEYATTRLLAAGANCGNLANLKSERPRLCGSVQRLRACARSSTARR
jgi:hypothetical protein